MREGWTYKKLMEVCDKGSSNLVISKLEGNNGEYPLYGASGLVKGVDFYQQEKPYIGIVKDGAGVGRVNIYPAQSSLVGTMQYIFPKDTCSLDYIKYFLIKLDLSKHVSGATIPHIYFKDYGKELIPLPPKSHQEAIVSELDEINSLLALKREQLQKYDKLAQSLFYEMFGDPVENEKGWEVKKLGEVCDVQNGFAFKSELFVTRGLPIVRISNIQNNEVTTDCVYFNEESYSSNFDRYKVPPGRILIAMSGATTGKCGINKTNTTFYLNQRVGMFIEDENLVNKLYLFSFLLTKTEESLNIAMGVAQPNLSTSQIKNYEIPLPPLSLQQQFASRIEQIEEQKQQVQAAIEKLETLLASRMQYWFD